MKTLSSLWSRWQNFSGLGNISNLIENGYGEFNIGKIIGAIQPVFEKKTQKTELEVDFRRSIG